MSANKASQEYKVPKGTLINKLNASHPYVRKMGPASILTTEEENRLCQWILDKSAIGYPMHPAIVQDAVQSVLSKVDRPNPFKNNRPGSKWLQLFLKRHPEVAKKNTEAICKNRAAVTETTIRQWFLDVQTYLQSINAADILENPSRIFNMDETGMQLCPKTGKVLAPRNEKNVYIISAGQEHVNITVLCAYSASGQALTPLIVYPYKRNVPAEIASEVPDGYAIGHSESGWMTTSTFYEYIANCFYPQLVQNSVPFPVVLFLDGHKSHISLELHDFCNDKQIILYCLVAHASHIYQPCDVGIFRPLKSAWKKTVAKHMQESNKPITKRNFAALFHTAFTEATNEQCIQIAFKASGLFPFDANNVNYSKCISKRWQEIKNRSVPKDVPDESSSHDSNASEDKRILLFIEKNTPPELLEEFRHNFDNNLEPAQEKQLYNMWKKQKILVEGSTLCSEIVKPYEKQLITDDSVIIMADDELGNIINTCDNIPFLTNTNGYQTIEITFEDTEMERPSSAENEPDNSLKNNEIYCETQLCDSGKFL